MTQAELDKKLGAALKREATARGWATKSGRAFKVEGEMFFSVVFLASRKERECYWSLSSLQGRGRNVFLGGLSRL